MKKLDAGRINFRQSRSSPDVRASSRTNHRAHRVPSSSVSGWRWSHVPQNPRAGALVSLDQGVFDTATVSVSPFGVLPSRRPGVSY